MAGVGARGEQLDLPAIGVGADVKFQVGGDAVHIDQPLAGRHKRLGDKVAPVAGQYFFPHPFGELVAPIRGFAGVAGHGFEEELFTLCPQDVGLFTGDALGGGDAVRQAGAVCAGNTPVSEQRVVRQGDQMLFVGAQRMGVGVRGDDGTTGYIGIVQGLVGGSGQVKVGQAVVDQVDQSLTSSAVVPELAISPLQRLRVGDDGCDAALLKHLAAQRKLRREILGVGRIVDDGDCSQRRITSLQTPFTPEHVKKRLLQCIQIHIGVLGRRHGRAAGAVGACQRGVEHSTAGVGVDFNQLRAFGRRLAAVHMKVVAHKCTQRAEGGLCNRGCGFESQGLVGWQLHDPLNHSDCIFDRLVGGLRQKYHAVGEQMRLRCGDAAGQALQAGVALQLLAQLVNIQGAAHAAVV